jgi:tetratricopeptide (TPR) repeat protein
VSDYTVAIRLHPQHCRAFYNRAFCNESLRRWDQAVADYSSALELEPTNFTAYDQRHARRSSHALLARASTAPHALAL